jgi:hypothetical protein
MSETKGEVKFSSILVDEGGCLRTYRSFDEVPVEVRQRIVAAMEHGNSGTVLIADRRMPHPVGTPPGLAEPSPRPLWNRKAVLELAVAGALALGVWILATLR